jgi:Kef-type K+ transport system membrane component KefB
VAPAEVLFVQLPVLVRFAIIMAICLLVPRLCQRVRLPACVGLLFVGVAVGPNGLHIFPQDGPVAGFLAQIGKLLLMFFAGLEIDLSQFRRTGSRSMGFGMLTFSVPMVIGTAVALQAGYGWLAGLLIGSLMASHTLLGFPIVQRMNLVNDEAVAVTVGGTILTDLLALLVLAVCVPIYTSGFSAAKFALQIVELVVYILVVLGGLSSLGRWLLSRIGDSKGGQVTLLFLIMTLAGIGAEAINLEGIVGAFLAGLAINRALSHTQAKEEFEFLGNTLFIPIFFVSIGFLINVRLFLQTLVGKPWLVLGIVGGLITAKFLAARAAQFLYRYSHAQGNMIWSLSMPQVAATLAAAIVAFETRNAAGVRLIDEPMINTVLVMVVVTSILGPILTEYFGRQCLAQQEAEVELSGLVPQ